MPFVFVSLHWPRQQSERADGQRRRNVVHARIGNFTGNSICQENSPPSLSRSVSLFSLCSYLRGVLPVHGVDGRRGRHAGGRRGRVHVHELRVSRGGPGRRMRGPGGRGRHGRRRQRVVVPGGSGGGRQLVVGEGVHGGVVVVRHPAVAAAAAPDHAEAAVVMVVVAGGGRGVVDFHTSGILRMREGGRRTDFPLGSFLARTCFVSRFFVLCRVLIEIA